MAGTTRLELATSAVTALREMALQSEHSKPSSRGAPFYNVFSHTISRGTSSISCLVLQTIEKHNLIELQTYAVRWQRPRSRIDDIRTKHG